MSLALKNLQKKRRAERNHTIWLVVHASLWLVPVVLVLAVIGRLAFGPSLKEWNDSKVQEVLNDPILFSMKYGDLWVNWFPHKYRTKEQVVRQDLGLEPKDIRLCVTGGASYVCADAPSNWMPGDYQTAARVFNDIRKERGEEAGREWLAHWGQTQSLGPGWGSR